MQPPAENPKSSLLEASIYNRCLFLQYRIWWYIVISLLILQLILMLGSLGSYNWVKSGDGDSEWEGSLMVVTSGPDMWEDISYEDLVDNYCEDDANTSDGFCEVFSDIYNGGVAFIFFEVFAMTANLVWIVKVLFLILEKSYGPNWLPYILNGSVLIFHLIALVAWFGSTSAQFGKDCEEVITEDEERGDLCATSGAALAVFVMVLFIGITALFIPLYIKRYNEDTKNSTDLTETEMIQNQGNGTKSPVRNLSSDRA